MEHRQSGHEPAPEFRLSQDAARELAGRTVPPRQRRAFLSTDHLSTEAAAAYVDGRLPQAGQTRADAHLALCAQCRREVDDQREARRALRGSGPINMPDGLRDRLRSLEGLGSLDGDTPTGRGEAAPDKAREAAEDASVNPWTRLLRRFRSPGN